MTARFRIQAERDGRGMVWCLRRCDGMGIWRVVEYYGTALDLTYRAYAEADLARLAAGKRALGLDHYIAVAERAARRAPIPMRDAIAEVNRGTLAERVARHKKRLRAKYPGVK